MKNNPTWEQIAKSNALFTRVTALPEDVQLRIKSIFNAYLDGYELALATTAPPTKEEET